MTRNTAGIKTSTSWKLFPGKDPGGFLDLNADPYRDWYFAGTPLSTPDGVAVTSTHFTTRNLKPGEKMHAVESTMFTYRYNKTRKTLSLKNRITLPEKTVSWGTSGVNYGGYHYMYGFKEYPHKIFLARIPVGKTGPVETLTKTGFKTGYVAPQNLRQVAYNFSSRFSVIYRNNSFYAVSRTGDIYPNIDLFKSAKPWGPFVFKQNLVKVANPNLGYHAVAHMSLDAGKGNFWVTTNNNGNGIYRPSWYRVPLSVFN